MAQQPHSAIVTRQVDFYPVHLLVAPILASVESWPIVGTLPWQALADTDPAKWAAVLDVAQYGALHLQLRQETLAESAKELASAENWSALAQRVQNGRGEAYIPRKAS
ncbi:DUF2742 domain-containing protein [Mycobacterium sp. PDNC021]|uniref:DUF2742 domain-containing protein n=1 Tax=Mycobacterium sp. PDNC021 TaxID=3391399 RepID=UPI003AB006D8